MSNRARISRALKRYQIDKAADGFSPHSIEATSWTIQRLSDFLGNPYLDEIEVTHLREFMKYMRSDYTPVRPSGKSKPLAEASLERVWSSIRSFYGWAEIELGTTRPDLRLRKPVYKAPLKKPFTQEEVELLLKATEKTAIAAPPGRRPFRTKRPMAKRDKAIILFLLDTGVRVSECARVCIEDVDVEQGVVTIQPFRSSKKSHPREVYIGKHTRRALWRYLDEREVFPGDPLFQTADGRPMNRNSIRYMLVRTGKRAGVEKVHPHRFRHTFAIQYLRNGGDVFTLQRLLGHSTLDMVKKYLAIVKDDSKNAHRSASPVDRWRL